MAKGKKLDIDLLKRLCEAPGIPGQEEEIRAVTTAALREVVDDLSIDAMGNLVGIRKGKGGPRIMIAAHMDEIGFMVSHIEDGGFLRLQPVGGFDPRVLVAQRVIVHGFRGERLRGALQTGARPIHLLDPSEIRPPKVEDLFVDLGMDGDEVTRRVEIGDMVTLDRTLEQVGDSVMSKSLDDRVGIFIMIEAIRAMKGSKAEIVAVATTQEEVGLRGARTAAHDVEPDLAIALDVTIAGDVPDAKGAHAVSRLGAGAAIKLMDSSMLSHRGLVRHARDLAERHKIPHQLEILPRGGTDAGAMQSVRGGVPAITLSIPTRYVHTVNEMARIADIQACIDLLALLLADAGNRDYRHRIEAR